MSFFVVMVLMKRIVVDDKLPRCVGLQFGGAAHDALRPIGVVGVTRHR